MKTYKILSLGLLLLLFSTMILAQKKCKFDKDEKDKFTNEHVRSSKFQVGGMMYRWYILLEQKGDKYYMTYQIAVNGKVDDPITKGTKILMKLANDSVVALVADQDYTPQQSVVNNGDNPFIATMWLPKGELSKDQMNKLSASPIVAIRTNIAGKDLDSPNFSSKESEKLEQTSACMLLN